MSPAKKLHPAQELWNKIEWNLEGPHVVVVVPRRVENDNTTTTSTTSTSTSTSTTTTIVAAAAIPPQPSLPDNAIVAYFPGNKQHRLPPLWKTNNGQILVESQIMTTTTSGDSTVTTTTTTVTPTACNNVALERLEQALVHTVEEIVLPKLVLVAILEEGLHQLVTSLTTSGTTTTTTTTTTSTSTSGRSSQQLQQEAPPKYYTTSPHSYLTPPPVDSLSLSPLQDSTATTTTTYTKNGTCVVTLLLQRIKVGTALALEYTKQLQHYHDLFMETSTDASSRRSRRLMAPLEPPILPNVLKKGGRICHYLIQEYNQNHHEKKEQQEKELSRNASHAKKEKEEEDMVKEEPVNDNNDKDDDDDFTPESEEEEEESLEANDDDDDVDELQVSSNVSDDDDSQQHSMDEILIWHNPHLQPTLESILDWMARRGKSLSTLTIQNAILQILRNKITLDIFNPLDVMVLHNLHNNNNNVLLEHANTIPLKVTLTCTSGESYKELVNMDVTEFGKCQFHWQVAVDSSWQQETMVNANQHAMEREYYAQLEYKKEKAWALWRYKGIQTGFTVWPQWTDAVTEWQSRRPTNSSSAAVPSSTTATLLTDATTTTTTTATTESADLALAQSMEQEEAGRRRTRRAGGDGGVFYGGQSGMSHKLLLDTIVRLAYQQPFQTMFMLSSLVADESSNPIHRIRVALGKLLWKYNQVTRVCVNSVWTDMPLWNVLKKEALLQVPAQFQVEKEEQEEKDGTSENVAALPVARFLPTPENLQHLKVLVEYIRNLHKTELELRSLLLHHLTSTPIATVATAADERAGSQEAVDAADFEGDHSTLEWLDTGHELLNQIIFRPSFLVNSRDTPECSWYRIQDYVPSVPMPPMEDDSRSDGRPREVIGKEPLAVERRMRFRAYPVTEDGEDLGEGAILVLTEGQVHAGIMAAKLERKKEAAAKSSAEHPFAIGAGSNITLQSIDSTVPDKHCQVAGYDTVPLQNGSKDELEHRILLLPQAFESTESTVAFWAVANIDENGILTCRPVDSILTFKILLSDCDSSSLAFQECEGIIDFLYRQAHSAIFAEPVDPVALKIPTYFSVVKHPMDISTVAANLEKGLYSKIPPGQNVGRSPVARMLNGPFKDDVVRIFDNAMLFNPPDDWIHHTAATMKKAVLKKIDQVSREADDRYRNVSPRKNRSVYVDEDSDVDLYEYESDRDDEEYGRHASRKRKRVSAKDDFSTQAMAAPIALRKTLSDSVGLRGPFSNLPINSEADGFSLSSEWNCRHRTASAPQEVKEDPQEVKRKQEMEELLLLHHQLEEEERAGLRRSSRAHPAAAAALDGDASPTRVPNDFEYFLATGTTLPPMGDEEADAVLHKSADSRAQVEYQREQLHELYFAKLYQQLSKFLKPIDKDYGSYENTFFPPFLGRVIPSMAPDNVENVTWEIRAPFVIPAIRWVLRGLVHSGHVTEMDTDVLLTNDVYYADDSQQPFDVLDMREMQRRKRANAASEEESEEEVELSEYEKQRAERVARNAERLRALGLA